MDAAQRRRDGYRFSATKSSRGAWSCSDRRPDRRDRISFDGKLRVDAIFSQFAGG
jgi:hypothetical protein